MCQSKGWLIFNILNVHKVFFLSNKEKLYQCSQNTKPFFANLAFKSTLWWIDHMCIVWRHLNYTELGQYICCKRQREVGGNSTLYLRVTATYLGLEYFWKIDIFVVFLVPSGNYQSNVREAHESFLPYALNSSEPDHPIMRYYIDWTPQSIFR